MISKDSYLSFFYAMDIIKGRFSEGEESISTNADYSFSYAIDILKGRFKSGEPVIKTEYYLMYLQYMKEYLTEEEYIELKLEF